MSFDPFLTPIPAAFLKDDDVAEWARQLHLWLDNISRTGGVLSESEETGETVVEQQSQIGVLDTQVDAVDTQTNTNTASISSIDTRVAVLESASTGITEYMYSVWAEENAALGASNTYEWAYGNGASTPNDGGITIYVPSGWTCEVVAMSLRVGGGTATVELVHNGSVKGSAANVVLSSGQSATNELGTPLAIVNNDYINFRTTSSSGTSGPCVVTAWLKMTAT